MSIHVSLCRGQYCDYGGKLKAAAAAVLANCKAEATTKVELVSTFFINFLYDAIILFIACLLQYQHCI